MAADYLMRVVQDCISTTVCEATEIMAWLKYVARTLARAGRGVRWTAPSGFPVLVEHQKYKKRRVVTAFGNLQIYSEDQPCGILSRRQTNAIAPNFVHSLDAAHMVLTANRLHNQGVCHFAMVHDSYGVHACHVDLMNRLLREEFVRIYRKPVLGQFLAEQRFANPDVDLDDSPKQGSLDVEAILRSSYFFS